MKTTLHTVATDLLIKCTGALAPVNRVLLRTLGVLAPVQSVEALRKGELALLTAPGTSQEPSGDPGSQLL